MKEIFIPSDPKNINRKGIACFLQNLEKTIAQDLFTTKELQLLHQESLYGKYLNKKTRSFFLYHFLPLWEKAIKNLFIDNLHPKIIELGCGTGTSSLLFALLGAKVIGIELNPELINICQKQKNFYEKYAEQVDVSFYNGDVFDISFKEHAPIDAFFSLFAFNLMKPHDLLFARLVSNLSPGGKIIIIDGNTRSIYNRLLPSRRRPGVPSSVMVQERLKALGCKILQIETHCALLPFIVRMPAIKQFAFKIEDILKILRLHKFLGTSYIVVAEKI